MRTRLPILFAAALSAAALAVPAERTARADTTAADSARHKPAAPGTPVPRRTSRDRTIAPFPVPGDTSALSVLRWRMLNLPRSGGTTVAPLPPPGTNSKPGATSGPRFTLEDSLLQQRLDRHARDCDDEYPELPEAVSRVAPVPPPGMPAAEAKRIVRVFLVVDEAGEPRALRTGGPPSALDSAAVACVRQWRFRPGRHCGHAFPAWVAVPIRFDGR